jgi:hypothetical protein
MLESGTKHGSTAGYWKKRGVRWDSEAMIEVGVLKRKTSGCTEVKVQEPSPKHSEMISVKCSESVQVLCEQRGSEMIEHRCMDTNTIDRAAAVRVCERRCSDPAIADKLAKQKSGRNEYIVGEVAVPDRRCTWWQ